jgi:hypothetical protein
MIRDLNFHRELSHKRIPDFNLTDDEIWRIIIELDKKFLGTSGDSLESPGGFKLRGEEDYEPQNLCWKSSL